MATVLPIINQCNQNCFFCAAGGREDNVGLEYVFQVMDREKESVAISGGEPTLSRNLFKIIEYAKEKKLKIELQTNGVTLSYFELTKKLAKEGVDLFNVNFPSHLEEVTDKITQTKGLLPKRIEGIKNLERVNANIRLTHVINSFNYKHLEDFIDYIKNNFKQIEYIQFSFIKIMGSVCGSEWMVPPYNDVQPYLLNALKKCAKYKIKFLIDHIPICYLPGFEDCHADFQKISEGADTYFSRKEKIKLKECRGCRLGEFCYGVRRDYIETFGKKNIVPASRADDKVTRDLKSLTALTNYLIKQKTEPTKYFFSSLFHRINPYKKYNAQEIKLLWELGLKNIRSNNGPDSLNFYVHIPFCDSKCAYCMYPSITVPEGKISNYLVNIYKEMDFFKNIFSDTVFRNIYIGGGSPTILNDGQLEELLNNLFKKFSFLKSGQKNFECNPRNATEGKFKILKEFGFNRVSLGVQSLDKGVLRQINRSYQTYESIEGAVRYGKAYGFSVNVDLMIGFQNDNPQIVKESFQKIIKLSPDCISLYPLKPPSSYLEKYFNNDERQFYYQLKAKINNALKLLRPIAAKFSYSCPDEIYLVDGYCGGFRRNNRSSKHEYFDSVPISSVFGIGWSSISKIIGTARYNNNLSPGEIFDPSKYCYGGSACNLRDDMRDYIFDRFSKGAALSREEFRRNFNCDVIDAFKYAFFALKELGKIKFDNDLVYFLPKSLKDMYIYGLFFWGDKESFLNYFN